ncbi:hypothetical protein K432DRAFT_417860 [Lepidopterella palustris CBS 459.81]|uniref:Uncharacterized protein n=1 Tax=Lepidopterella palustris CBS 459.81 TaxID=1314670 RepID=A0A8E2E7M5_9PEZI|nr:hypothetical protein K432DRAFT_417860 [Lepidopterella palustris CBS 459.81]
MDVLGYLLSPSLSELPDVGARHRTTRILFELIPFGDDRHGLYLALWTFDIENDALLYVDRHHRSWIPLTLLRERNMTLADMESLGPPWRHVLRNSYSSLTLRVLARAIIWISTLNFEADIVRVGKAYIVLCQSIEKGLSVARRHVISQETVATESSRTTDYAQEQAHYMILSVKHIMLCHVTGPNTLEYTAPESLFNGNTGPPSDLGLHFLIWATAAARNSIITRLVSLPVKVQDIIFGYVSAGTVAAAKTGCLLHLGCPCLWKDGPFNIVLEETCTNRTPWSPVESQV